MRLMQRTEIVRGLCRRDPLQDARRHFHQRDREPELRGDRRRLQPDIAAADDHDAGAGTELVPHGIDIAQPAHGIDTVQPASDGVRQAARNRAGCQDELIIGDDLIAEGQPAGGAVDTGHALAKTQGDRLFRIEIDRAQGQAVNLHLAEQIGLGQGGALIGRRGLFADQGDLARKTASPEPRHQCRSGLTRPDNHHMRHVFALCLAETHAASGRVPCRTLYLGASETQRARDQK